MKQRIALTTEIVAAAILTVLAITLAIQHESALAAIFGAGALSFVVDTTRRIRRVGKV
ncbi:hypothetical protein ACFWC5_05975 [Streptomyces sp. NPDC060085]|uniref:hypothetical protein n=1 Tax=Streptomyces sp. NPDC060085 TaxID=3347054 RepID=UPI0036602D2D